MSDMDEFRQMVDDCEQRESRMTEWERTFIDSLSRLDRAPSAKQVETLNEIWDRVTEKG